MKKEEISITARNLFCAKISEEKEKERVGLFPFVRMFQTYLLTTLILAKSVSMRNSVK